MECPLYFFEHVERTVADIVSDLCDPDAGVFQTATDSAVAGTRQLRSRLHVDVGGLDVGREVTIDLGAPEQRPYGVLIPIRWRAARQVGLFPSMNANLEISVIDHDIPLSQLSIIGSYRPPAGFAGAIGDGLLGHRLAEAAVRHFVTELAARLSPVTASH
jgi:hypothetical protein